MKIIPNLYFAATFFMMCFMALATPVFAAGGNDEASKYVQQLGNNALAAISNASHSKEQKQADLEKLFSSNVDFPWVARFVMGHFWRQATDDQKTRYIAAYERFLILHYTARFIDYTSGTFAVTNARDDGDGEFTISMKIQSGDAQSEPVLVDYRVRKESNGFKIFDVIVEGVSLITTQRSEFASVITNNGIDYLITQLATKSKNGDVEMGTK